LNADHLKNQPKLTPSYLVKKILLDPSLKNSIILTVSAIISGALAYLYNAYAAKLLGPGEYGILGVTMSVYFILAVSLAPLSNVITKLTSEFKATGQDGQIVFLVSVFTRRMFLYGAPFFLLTAFLSLPLSQFLNMDSPVPVILVGLLFWSGLLLVTVRGILQGLQQFTHIAFSQSSEAVLRLLGGVSLLSVGLGVNGAIAAFVLASGLSFIALFVLLRRQYQNPPVPFSFPNLYRYSSSALIMTLCFTASQNMDILLVKHYFDAEQAGIYVATTLVGKLLSLFSIPFYRVMFPQVSEANAQNKNTTPMLVKTLTMVGVACSLFIFLSWSFGHLVISISFGQAYAATAPLLWRYGIATMLLILSGTIAYYKLALANTDFEIPLIGGVCLELILLIFFHKSLGQVIGTIILSNGVMLAAMLIPDVIKIVRIRLTKKI
jgi:O-antigen/teichoic acid export membrane protein